MVDFVHLRESGLSDRPLGRFLILLPNEWYTIRDPMMQCGVRTTKVPWPLPGMPTLINAVSVFTKGTMVCRPLETKEHALLLDIPFEWGQGIVEKV